MSKWYALGIEEVEKKLMTIPYVTDMLNDGYSAEKMLEAILGDLELEILEKSPMQYKCTCSKDRVEKAIISLGKKEISQIIEEDKKAELTCQFCGKVYNFNETELKDILLKACSK